jgi:hypothetical protein
MKRAFVVFLSAFLIAYCVTMSSAIVMGSVGANDCTGCDGISTTLTCESGGGCPGSIRLGVDCSKCCNGTTCHKKEGYAHTEPPPN